MIFYSQETTYVSNLVSSINSEFALRKLGKVNYFLGIEVSRTSSAFHPI